MFLGQEQSASLGGLLQMAEDCGYHENMMADNFQMAFQLVYKAEKSEKHI